MEHDTKIGERTTGAYPLLALLVSYFAAAVVFASTSPHPIVDDWIYVDAATRFAETGTIDISTLSVPVAIFESVFGGVVVLLFGSSVAVLGLGSASLAAIAGIALYDILRRTGLEQVSATLVTGAFLFAPLFFGLSMTFMTDSHGISLALIAAALFSRGIDGPRTMRGWLVAGSFAASAAYLSRPAAVVVIVGVLLITFAKRQWMAVPWILTVPTITVVAHLMYQAFTGVPVARAAVMEHLMIPSLDTLADSAVVILINTGIWLIPLVPLIFGAVLRRRTVRSVRVWILGLAIAFTLLFLVNGLPPIGDWLNASGMFPVDTSVVGIRSALLVSPWIQIVALVCIVTSAVSIGLVAGSPHTSPLSSTEIGLWAFAVGSIALSSISLVATSGTMLDRYVVVLLPAVLVSVSIRGLLPEPMKYRAAGFATLGLVAILGVILALDGIRVQNAVFATADSAVAKGIPADDIDGGAAWTGTMLGNLVPPDYVVLPDGPYWWRETFAVSLEPRFVVALTPQDGACVESITTVTRIVGPDQPVLLLDTHC